MEVEVVRVTGGKVVRGRGVSVNDYVIGGWGCERVVVVGRVVLKGGGVFVDW